MGYVLYLERWWEYMLPGEEGYMRVSSGGGGSGGGGALWLGGFEDGDRMRVA